MDFTSWLGGKKKGNGENRRPVRDNRTQEEQMQVERGYLIEKGEELAAIYAEMMNSGEYQLPEGCEIMYDFYLDGKSNGTPIGNPIGVSRDFIDEGISVKGIFLGEKGVPDFSRYYRVCVGVGNGDLFYMEKGLVTLSVKYIGQDGNGALCPCIAIINTSVEELMKPKEERGLNVGEPWRETSFGFMGPKECPPDEKALAMVVEEFCRQQRGPKGQPLSDGTSSNSYNHNPELGVFEL